MIMAESKGLAELHAQNAPFLYFYGLYPHLHICHLRCIESFHMLCTVCVVVFLFSIKANMESKSAQGKIDESRWVIQIREGLDYVEEEVKSELCVSIFSVPKELLATKPQAYIPQVVSIGPYHHWKSELYETERYKVAAARRAQKRLNGDQKLEAVVEEFQKLEWQIRSCYHKCLAYKGETLAWLMALDASFLLECLEFYVDKDAARLLEAEFIKQLGPAFHPKGRSAAHNAIVRDMVMLENQVPLFLLQKLLEMQYDAKEKAEEKLCALVRQACKELSPFKFALPEISSSNVKERAHILELLYYAVVPIARELDEITDENELPTVDAGPIEQALRLLWSAFTSLKIRPVQRLLQFCQRALNGRPVQFLMKLPWRILSTLCNLPVLRIFKGLLGYIFNFSTANGKKDEEASGSSSQYKSQEIPPVRDELAVPSVSDLYRAGVKFAPTKGDLTTIRFDEKAVTLYLPGVTLDANTEVILRNLIAFEATAAPGAFVFTRYVDFINGMIDTEEDVRLLIKSGIIYNHLHNDQEVANLWNSMGKCVCLSKVKYLDRVIVGLNKYYGRRWNVVVVEYVNKYVFGSWQCLSLLAAAILLLLTCLQAFCSVYDCKKWLSNSNFTQS